MELTIKMLNGRQEILQVAPQDTVGSLKQRIYQTLGVSPHCQRLIYENGSRVTLSDDSLRLCDYGLQSGAQVMLLITESVLIQVFLRNEKGQTTTYDIQPDEGVTSFKAKVEAKEKVPAAQQRLIHEGKEMADGSKLADYGVKNLSTIYLTFRLRGG